MTSSTGRGFPAPQSTATKLSVQREDFLRGLPTGKAPILKAASARGLDIYNAMRVINYDAVSSLVNTTPLLLRNK
jgi:superfamily II DNA/RNA helicase